MIFLSSPAMKHFGALCQDLSPQEQAVLTWRSIGTVFKTFALVVAIIAGLLFLALPGILLLGIVVTTWYHTRRGRQRALLSVIATALRHGVQLDPILREFAIENGDNYYWARMCRLRAMLLAGESLADSLDRVRSLLPARSVVLIRAAETSGRLPESLDAIREMSGRPSPVQLETAYRLFYILACGAVVSSFVLWNLLWIAPKMQEIFYDFGIELPAVTVYFILVTDVFARYWYLLPLLVLMAAMLWLGVCWLVRLSRGEGLALWPPPGFRWVFRSRDTACIFRACSFFVGASRPVVDALRLLAARFPFDPMRRRLERVVLQVEAGRPWLESLQDQKIGGRAEIAVLESAQRAGNLAWALQEMGSSVGRRSFYRFAGWMQVAFVGCIVFLGLCVGFYAVAFFLPLIKLITVLT